MNILNHFPLSGNCRTTFCSYKHNSVIPDPSNESQENSCQNLVQKILNCKFKERGGGKLKCALNDVINKPNIPNIACGEMTRVNGYA